MFKNLRVVRTVHILKTWSSWVHENGAPYWFMYAIPPYPRNHFLFFVCTSAKNGERKIDRIFFVPLFACRTLHYCIIKPDPQTGFSLLDVWKWSDSLETMFFFHCHQQVQTVILKKVCATGKQTRNGSFDLIGRDQENVVRCTIVSVAEIV